MTDILGLNHPFFRPRVRRVIIVMMIALWAVVELLWGNMAWALGCIMLAGFCAWEFFVAFDGAGAEGEADGGGD